MDDCRRTTERLTPYVDEALPPEQRSDVERHLDRCPPCRRSAVEERGGRTVMRECAGRLRQPALPPGLRSRCEALAREQGPRSAAPWLSRFIPAALAAAIVTIAAVGLFSVATRQSTTLLAAQLTADHVKCFQFFGSGGGADAREVERDLDARFGWEMHVPASSQENGLRLLGGFRCLYGEGTMPHVMYRAAGAVPVSLFRLDRVTPAEADISTLGYRCRIWSRGGHTYALVTPESAPQDQARLVRYIQQEAR